MVHRVGTDRHCRRRRQSSEFPGRDGAGIRRGCCRDVPFPRDSVDHPVDLGHGERQEVTTDLLEVGPERGPAEPDPHGPAGRLQGHLLDAGRTCPYSSGRSGPTKSPGRSLLRR